MSLAIPPSQQLVRWADAKNRLELENATPGAAKVIQDFLKENEPKLGRHDVPRLQSLNATLFKCKLDQGEFASLQDKIQAVIRNLENFQSYLPKVLLHKVVEYLAWNDRIEQLIALPSHLCKARLDQILTLKDIDCRRIGNEMARLIDQDLRVDRDPDLIRSDFCELFLLADLWQQEDCIKGWIAESKEIWKIFDVIPGEVEKLFLNFDILAVHLVKVPFQFSGLKVLHISKQDKVFSLGLLDQVNLSNLEELDLRNCVQIDDVELEAFMSNPTLKKLKKLDLSHQSEISIACVQKLHRKFPRVKILSIYEPKVQSDDVQ